MMNEKDTTQFINALSQLKISLTQLQINQFMTYYDLLIEWNEVMNLTTITEFDEVITKHFIDSLSIVNGIDLTDSNDSIIDIGTGAGFPGIPLKIAFPNLKITLLDSLNKRVKFLEKVITVLELQDITALHGRAEDFAATDKLREQFDYCVSRAVANLSTLSEYCLPYVKIGGKFISYKSEKVMDESKQAKGAIFLLGGKISNQVEFTLPNSDIYRNIFIIDKVNSTPKKYPRKAGLPAKEPLT